MRTSKKQTSKAFDKVYKLLRTVPRGKVTTYGAIGKKLNMSPRVVGFALHANPDSDNNPCHRVVNREGRLAPGFAFGGTGAQKQLLEQERVEFIDSNHVDLQKYFFGF